MLRVIRIILAVFFFTSITWLFLDFTGTLNDGLGWTAKRTFLPAVFSHGVGVLLGILVLTLLVGRFYCSAICPLGVFQDCVSWLAGKRKKRRFAWRAAARGIRYGVLRFS